MTTRQKDFARFFATWDESKMQQYLQLTDPTASYQERTAEVDDMIRAQVRYRRYLRDHKRRHAARTQEG